MILAVRISSYRCTWKVWRALDIQEVLSSIIQYNTFIIEKVTKSHTSWFGLMWRSSKSSWMNVIYICISESWTNKYDITFLWLWVSFLCDHQTVWWSHKRETQSHRNVMSYWLVQSSDITRSANASSTIPQG